MALPMDDGLPRDDHRPKKKAKIAALSFGSVQYAA